MAEIDQDALPYLDNWREILENQVAASRDVVLDEAMFRRLTPPRRDRIKPASGLFNMLDALKPLPTHDLLLDLLDVDEMRNATVYAPGNPMLWHTNSDAPGIRLYYVHNAEAGSLFAYQDPEGAIHYEVEPVGWSVRGFTIPRDELFWHAVWAKGVRVCFGFMREED